MIQILPPPPKLLPVQMQRLGMALLEQVLGLVVQIFCIVTEPGLRLSRLLHLGA
jgi:hypothetical protein